MNSELIIKIWSSKVPDEDISVPRISDHDFELTGVGKVSCGDIPADILLTVPDIVSVTELRLCPYVPENDEYARTYALKFAKKQAVLLGGAVEEILPDGGRKVYREGDAVFSYPALNEYTPKMHLSVWYAPDEGFDAAAGRVVDIFEKYLPFALPSAYGSSEPLENQCGKDGENFDKEKFIDFLKEESAPIWYARSPLIGVYIRDAHRSHARREGFRANCITVEFPEKIYDYREWSYALRKVLRELCAACGAFFGQIAAGDGGVASWWWQGIPDDLGVACVIGEPYFSLIADCEGENADVMCGDGKNGKTAYFEEPNGPRISSDLLSLRRKRFFKKKSPYLSPDDFTKAEKFPF